MLKLPTILCLFLLASACGGTATPTKPQNAKPDVPSVAAQAAPDAEYMGETSVYVAPTPEDIIKAGIPNDRHRRTYFVTDLVFARRTTASAYVGDDDPRLLHTLVTFGKKNMYSDRGIDDCPDFFISKKKITLRKLLRKYISQGKDQWGQPMPYDTAKTMRIPIPENTVLDVDFYYCDGVPKKHYDYDFFTFILPDGQMALYDGYEVLLKMRLVENSFIPNPGFNCKKPTSPTEKTICNSAHLARLHKAAMYTIDNYLIDQNYIAYESQAIEKQKEAEMIIEARKKWLSIRDKCGENPNCLSALMIDTISFLPTYYQSLDQLSDHTDKFLRLEKSRKR
jgi:hypothetical protein